MSTRADCLVVVFARAPLAGRVKTRLVPRLGAARAARLHERLVRAAVHTAQSARCGAVELHCAPSHALLRTLGVPVRLQRGRDLGERMHRALRAGLRRHRAVLLMGADAPSLSSAHLRRAARLLRGAADVVLAPAQDGGYALIGARRIDAAVFAGVPWGTEAVLGRTRDNLRAARLAWRELPAVWDVDRPEDLDRLARLLF